jgi:hypothetical protein
MSKHSNSSTYKLNIGDDQGVVHVPTSSLTNALLLVNKREVPVESKYIEAKTSSVHEYKGHKYTLTTSYHYSAILSSNDRLQVDFNILVGNINYAEYNADKIQQNILDQMKANLDLSINRADDYAVLENFISFMEFAKFIEATRHGLRAVVVMYKDTLIRMCFICGIIELSKNALATNLLGGSGVYSALVTINHISN